MKELASSLEPLAVTAVTYPGIADKIARLVITAGSWMGEIVILSCNIPADAVPALSSAVCWFTASLTICNIREAGRPLHSVPGVSRHTSFSCLPATCGSPGQTF